MESTLASLNRLNRSLESVTAVGNEFGSVEALWSTFETVMGADAHGNKREEEPQDEGREEEGEEDETIRMKEESAQAEEEGRWKSESTSSRR